MIVIEASLWVWIVSILLLVSSFYFVLTFVESLRKGDERITRQSKTFALLCLSVALLLPVIFGILPRF